MDGNNLSHPDSSKASFFKTKVQLSEPLADGKESEELQVGECHQPRECRGMCGRVRDRVAKEEEEVKSPRSLGSRLGRPESPGDPGFQQTPVQQCIAMAGPVQGENLFFLV